MAYLNIGLNVNGIETLTEDRIRDVLFCADVAVLGFDVHQSDSERTAVVTIREPLTEKLGDTIARVLDQEAIAQLTRGKGSMFGPKKNAWGDFNPEYFLLPDGTRARPCPPPPPPPVPARMPDVSDLVGKTMASVENLNNEALVFTTTEGRRYKLYHAQDCCESVTIESIVGDLADLVGEPILVAEECVSDYASDGFQLPDGIESCTWTFYKFSTRRGYVDVRWFGESNGYYSESVDFVAE